MRTAHEEARHLIEKHGQLIAKAIVHEILIALSLIRNPDDNVYERMDFYYEVSAFVNSEATKN